MLCFLYQNIFSSTTMNWISYTCLDASISREIIGVSLSPYIQSTYLPRSSYTLCIFRFFQVFSRGIIDLTHAHAHVYTRNRSSFKLSTTHVYTCIGSRIFFVSISLSSSVVFQFDPFLICYHIRFYEYERYLFCLISFRSTWSVFMVMVMECGQIW